MANLSNSDIICVASIGLGLSLSNSLFIVAYICCVANRRPTFRNTVKNEFLKQFNLHLLVMSLSVSATFAIYLCTFSGLVTFRFVAVGFINFFFAIVEFSFVQCSSSRALPIILKMYPGAKAHLARFLTCLPFIIFAQVVPIAAKTFCPMIPACAPNWRAASTALMAAQCVAGAAVVGLDVLFLCGFSKYTCAWQADGGALTWRLIVLFGACACVLSALMFAFYALSFAIGVGENLGVFLQLIAFMCAAGAVFVLTVMKVSVANVAEQNPSPEKNTPNAKNFV